MVSPASVSSSPLFRLHARRGAWRRLLGGGLLLLLLWPLPAAAFITPFGRVVNDSIDHGLAWFRAKESNGSIGGEPTGLAVLTFLERRASVDWNAPPGATPAWTPTTRPSCAAP